MARHFRFINVVFEDAKTNGGSSKMDHKTNLELQCRGKDTPLSLSQTSEALLSI